MDANKKPTIITFIGNIGSGKTTLVTELYAELCNALGSKFIHPLYEPVEEWKKSGILKAFYEDVHKMALPMQMYAFSSRLRQLKLLITREDPYIIVMDGSIYTDRDVFKEALKDDGHISEAGEKMYEKTFENWEKLVPEHIPSLWIYLNTSPVVCEMRKRSRGRPEEATVDIEYLKKLDAKLEATYEKYKTNGYNIVKIDGTLPVEQIAELALHESLKSLYPKKRIE